jgi:hypothetical protein
MQVEIGRGLLIDQLEEAQELSVSMPRDASSDNLAVVIASHSRSKNGVASLAYRVRAKRGPMINSAKQSSRQTRQMPRWVASALRPSQ